MMWKLFKLFWVPTGEPGQEANLRQCNVSNEVDQDIQL